MNSTLQKLSLGLSMLAALGLGACNTIEGAGRDIESAGDAVEDAADETEDEIDGN